MTKEAFEALKTQLKSEPQNTALMTQIANVLMCNPSYSDEEDIQYLELAYQTEKTVTTIHNLAFWLYVEYGEEERAITLQQSCLALKPKLYMPYLLMGYMLLNTDGDTQQAVNQLEQAKERIDNDIVTHNLGVAYYQNKAYQKAIAMFKRLNTDKAYYNLALCYLQIKDMANFQKTIDYLNENIALADIDELDIAYLFIYLSDYQTALEYIKKVDLNNYYLLSYTEIMIVLWHQDKPLFHRVIEKRLNQHIQWINETKQKIESTQKDKEDIEYWEAEMAKYQALSKQFMGSPPKIDIPDARIVYTDCLLYGCEMHKIPANDA